MIPEFFENREIFLTGGSGVVGKGVIDKLLRSCNVRKIYMLLRPKKNFSLEDRLKKIKSAMIFNRLHKEKPNEFDEKICIIPGDVTEPMLGITPEHAKLIENVSVVFHSAATVRFDEPLRGAILLNVAGTWETLRVAETLKNLKVFLYVSTFYSNPYLKSVEEKIYDTPMDWKFCVEMAKRNDVSDEILDTITRKLITGFPNTYTFTKNLAESMVNDWRHKLPVAIYRPTVIIFALEDPAPGFPSTLIGATGLFALSAAGILKTLFVDEDLHLDMCPQDIVIKTMLYFTVKTSVIYTDNAKLPNAPVFVTSTYGLNKFTLPQYIRMIQKFGLWHKYALQKSFLMPEIICTKNRLLFKSVIFIKQLLPSLLIDGILKLCGRAPILLPIQRKTYTVLEAMKPFLLNNYATPGITDLDVMYKKLAGTDFNIDPVKYGNNYYMNVSFVNDMTRQIREVLLKEDPKSLPLSRWIMRSKVLFYRLVQLYLAYKMYQMFVPIVTNWLDATFSSQNETWVEHQ